jgi:mannose-6-phosphate isomerase-like protein (cupin superfamily)
MNVFHLGADALHTMVRTDIANATEEPPSPIGYFDFHGCTCGIASFVGRPPWEHHVADELLHVLDGECHLTIRGERGDEKCTLRAGDLVIVPQRSWHSNDAPTGVTLLFMTPSEGSSHSWDDPDDTS